MTHEEEKQEIFDRLMEEELEYWKTVLEETENQFFKEDILKETFQQWRDDFTGNAPLQN